MTETIEVHNGPALNEIMHSIDALVKGEDLSEEQATRAFSIILSGGATPAQMAAMLIGLRVKGETVAEITGAAKAIRSKCGEFKAPENALDTCGTGGDASGSFNISTAVAFAVAACGVPVAKHGNRAITSLSGSADVLTQLGVNIMAEQEVMERALAEANICFMMAPKFHSAMRHVAPVRQELGIRTMFNVLGPLCNPARTHYHLMGVYAAELTENIAASLMQLGARRAWVVHGNDGMDEITTTTTTRVSELKDGKIHTFELNPQEYGIALVEPEALAGKDSLYNAKALRDVLSPNNSHKAYQDIVLLNAAACLVIADKVEDVQTGLETVRAAIKRGDALGVLNQLVEISNAS